MSSSERSRSQSFENRYPQCGYMRGIIDEVYMDRSEVQAAVIRSALNQAPTCEALGTASRGGRARGRLQPYSVGRGIGPHSGPP